jgi:hypothetical protein
MGLLHIVMPTGDDQTAEVEEDTLDVVNETPGSNT